jgi:creatinine amidohydrolase/Fe(II)-dependent formamide hydrolase-like protein
LTQPKSETRKTAKDNSLRSLQVLQKLEVGPVQVKRRQIQCPYTVTKQDSVSTFNLTYRFEEDVFEPSDPMSINLASMITAQVAINYGLFCREIIFHDLLDQVDQKFISDMMANTAREIYVLKFLEPNAFLIGEASDLPAVKKESYLQANLSFPMQTSPANLDGRDRKSRSWLADKAKHAILSSGGKDSLLSFGLLKEIGKDAHPIFINESGRHWFTALNGYRYFAANYSETSKVWTNTDRLFAWMLRQFPFIRQDFSQIRSDEYPIRLWTVAAFLFGALPLLRKRRIGRLVIGDEFDTTNRTSYKGIAHYNGYYDQSRYFDNALTRYFYRKGWNISQFSLLRPLSELLIEKILYERYPFLQRNQVSCHATHIKNNRVFPCGKCEKCRRIVGILKAIDGDPTNCGYTPEQIADSLHVLPEKGIHQEKAGAQHLFFLLKEKALIAKVPKGLSPRPRPEITKLRFDPEKSPFTTIPTDLRKPLYKICLKHADGAVKRLGRLWTDFKPLEDPQLLAPYLFESKEGKSTKKDRESIRPVKTPNPHLLGELSWPEAQKRLNEVDIALLPVGSIEQHGPHLPLDTDAFDAQYLAQKVAEACSEPKPLVLPLIPYGVSYHHDDFSGTMGISPKTLSTLVYDVGMSAVRHGITKLMIINGHGGNIPALQFAAQLINRDAHIFTCVETGETSERDIMALTETPNDVHAGEVETSTALANRTHLVHTDKLRKYVPRFSIRYLNFSSKRSVEWYARVAKISPTGVLGDPTKASRQKGTKIWQEMIKHLVEFVEELKTMSLDEIYHRRY